MAILNAWQRIDRVLAGSPFGDGADGALTISASATQSLTVQSCTGTATQSTLTIASGAFTNGDVVMLHQSRGTGVGQWEVNRVVSGGGTTTLTLLYPLTYTYTDSGASQAQCIKIPRYTTVTVNTSQNWTGQAWDTGSSTVGGFLIFAANTQITGAGNLLHNNGYNPGPQAAVNTAGNQAEGTAGGGGTRTVSNNGSGGGGGGDRGTGSAGGGGGGGNGAAGTNGGTGTGSGGTPLGGDASGSADLTTMTFGGGGGGGGGWNGNIGPAGGLGGGILCAFVKHWGLTGVVTLNGGNGVNGWTGGGGGAGGSGLIFCDTGAFGSSTMAALGGTGGTRQADGGAGGAGAVGRYAIHHTGVISGTTNPTFTDVPEPLYGGSFLLNFV